MEFKQYENGSCDIQFSIKERWVILKKGKVHLSDESLRHFGNRLVEIVADWNLKFNEDLKNKITTSDDKIEGK